MARQRRIHAKPLVYRRAVAEGELRLAPGTRAAIRGGRIEKGDPRPAGELAGLVAIKRTPELLPHCHPIPITGSSVELALTRRGVRARATVEAIWRTGVEMEALVGVTIALLVVWDMVKYLEKNARGEYPTARLGAVRVVAKLQRAWRETNG
jgi:cyclic pyranopterin monophosphate synthase